MNPSRVFVALGSNLGDSPDLIRSAMDRLQELSFQPIRRSSLWTSAPIDCPPGSPTFVNAVVELTPASDLTPELLLASLQELEREFGRLPKKILNESRPLDLDLIHWDNQLRQTAVLTLPHPRAHLRRFVLQPLHELAPDLVLPGQILTVRALLEAVSDQEVMIRMETTGSDK
jgi:2-amino-4-hydroxy-6-hydroxymethyldihydropteridine diphosphokinase